LQSKVALNAQQSVRVLGSIIAISLQFMPAARFVLLALSALFALCVAGCGGSADPVARAASAAGLAPPPAASVAASEAGRAAGPAVTVTTVRAQKRDLQVLLSATGSVAPISSVDVRPQVTSIVTRVHIREGQFVKAGEVLFTLDARTDEANVAKARAQLAKDEVALADAQRQLARSRDLLAQNFISQGALDANQTLVDSQLALINADRAALDAARVALSNARITAPSAGRAGAINVFPGSSVQANQTALVSITQLDPIAVAFSLPQRHLADALAGLQGGGAPVTALLPEKGGALTGRLQFVDNAIDPASGTVKVKAVFANREGKLWPGAFLDVSMNVRTLKDAVVVPQAAIIQSARGPILYVADDGKAALRAIQVLYAQGDDAAVTGVRPGEAIVLDGRQNLRPGVSVVERAREPGARAASGPGRAASGTASGPASGAQAAVPRRDAASGADPRKEKPTP
jgi:RND family efflux transporter MFP subunit